MNRNQNIFGTKKHESRYFNEKKFNYLLQFSRFETFDTRRSLFAWQHWKKWNKTNHSLGSRLIVTAQKYQESNEILFISVQNFLLKLWIRDNRAIRKLFLIAAKICLHFPPPELPSSTLFGIVAIIGLAWHLFTDFSSQTPNFRTNIPRVSKKLNDITRLCMFCCTCNWRFHVHFVIKLHLKIKLSWHTLLMRWAVNGAFSLFILLPSLINDTSYPQQNTGWSFWGCLRSWFKDHPVAALLTRSFIFNHWFSE